MLQQNDAPSVPEVYLSKKLEVRKEFGRAIVSCLRVLAFTEFRSDDCLVTLWAPQPGTEYLTTISKVKKHPWTRLLQDTRSVCAFTVLDARCLGFSYLNTDQRGTLFQTQTCESNSQRQERTADSLSPWPRRSVLQTAMILDGRLSDAESDTYIKALGEHDRKALSDLASRSSYLSTKFNLRLDGWKNLDVIDGLSDSALLTTLNPYQSYRIGKASAILKNTSSKIVSGEASCCHHERFEGGPYKVPPFRIMVLGDT